MRPSEQLLSGRVNGQRIISGGNQHETLLTSLFAPEEYIFIPKNITTEAELEGYVKSLFPYFPDTVYPMIQNFYPEPTQSNGLYDDMTGRIAAMSGELLLNCPSYWLAQAFPSGNAYNYEWQSIPSSLLTNGSSSCNPRNGFDRFVSRRFPISTGNRTVTIYIRTPNGLVYCLR